MDAGERFGFILAGRCRHIKPEMTLLGFVLTLLLISYILVLIDGKTCMEKPSYVPNGIETYCLIVGASREVGCAS